ncbi:APC amino acid permease [Trametes versicolor FP-101664 SS1]|uniref:APC amino acid permease n=1 Tax=Trametes versicolor (strain FP-101664) TaxID=717944 RepID=UPI0004623886|nr:APC amino acid permease [Trametes versicolor FP-101664 SS1]EIW55875.1 APC amino acid permease [Trametes versicolor FP-101664 SS1]
MSLLTGKEHTTPSTVHVTEVAGNERHSTDGDSLTSDNAALAALGYKQEFKRAFNPIEVFGLGFSIIGLFPSIASVLVFAIPNGGPVALVWGWALCSFFLMFVGLALAELGSSAPTSGGLYYWTWCFATPKWRKVLSWVVGYSNSMGLIAGLASIDWGCAVQLMAAVSIGTNESFIPTTGQTFAVYVALLICHGVVASLATSVIARLQGIYVVLNILLCFAIIVALPIATPHEFKNSASYAFGGFANFNGWPNGFAFVLSFLAPLWTIGGFDASVHISEEASNARTAVPWAIISAVGIAGILGWAINVVIAFCMGTDLESIMENPIGQPMATILFNSFGRSGTLAIWSIVVFVQFLMGSSILTAASRQTFAFARDGALPFSRFISRVNKRTLTPVNAVWASALVALLLGLLVFAGPTAYTSIFSLGIAGQYTAYCIPILSRFLGGREWVPGPFTLGRFGLPVAVVAVCWMIFSVVMLAFPTAPGPTANEMNYMIVVFGGWIALCLVYYYFPVYRGAQWFNGPQTTLGHAGLAPSETTGSTNAMDDKQTVQVAIECTHSLNAAIAHAV